MKYKNIKGVIFDMGSTLIEFEYRSWDELTEEAQKLGYDNLARAGHKLPDFEKFNSRLEEIKHQFRDVAIETLNEWKITTAYANLLREYDVPAPEKESLKFVKDFFDIVRRGMYMIDGANDLFEELHKRGIKIGLISNTIFPGEEHDIDLQNYGLMRYFEFRIFSCDFGFRKPKAEIFEEALRLIKLPPEQTVYVGDRYREDVLGPQAVGMNTILKYREGREYPEPMPDGFPVVNSLREILGHIE